MSIYRTCYHSDVIYLLNTERLGHGCKGVGRHRQGGPWPPWPENSFILTIEATKNQGCAPPPLEIEKWLGSPPLEPPRALPWKNSCLRPCTNGPKIRTFMLKRWHTSNVMYTRVCETLRLSVVGWATYSTVWIRDNKTNKEGGRGEGLREVKRQIIFYRRQSMVIVICTAAQCASWFPSRCESHVHNDLSIDTVAHACSEPLLSSTDVTSVHGCQEGHKLHLVFLKLHDDAICCF